MQIPDLGYQPTVPVVLRRAAKLFSDRDFVMMPDRRLTYAQAELASRRLARRLIQMGIGKGSRIGFQFPYGFEWILTWLALSRIGAVCMPLSTAYKPAEMQKVLRFGDIQGLIVPGDIYGDDRAAFMEAALPGLRSSRSGDLLLPEAPYLRNVWMSASQTPAWAKPIDVSTDIAEPAGAPDDGFLELIEKEVHPADPMIVIYTSGTTSEPKGAIHTHGSALRHAANVSPVWGFTPDTRLFCAMPFFWVGGVGLTLTPALHMGFTVLCVEKFEADIALDLMEREGATAMTIWPQLGQKLEQYVRSSGRNLQSIPLYADPHPSRDPELRHNGIGMTETWGPYTAFGNEARRVLPEEMRGASGLPVPCLQYRVAEPATNRPLADGEDGEICVRGYSLLAGMVKKERHEVFDDDGYFHTGDKGHFRDGYLYYKGRLGDMIKSTGANVAPREVEKVLEACSGVGLVVVLGIPDAGRGEMVAAAIAPRPGGRVDQAEVRKRAENELSSFKVPRRYLFLGEADVPYLATGKPDKLRIRQMLIDLGS